MKDSAYQLGISLVKKKVVEFDVLEKALKIKQHEGLNGRRNLAQILVDDFNLDHNHVFGEVARLYGFREVKLTEADLSDQNISQVRKKIDLLPESIRNLMEQEKILLLKTDPQVAHKLILVSVNPICQHAPTVARALGAKKYEICFLNTHDFQKLHDKIFPPQNEFLKNLEESSLEIDSDEADEGALEEEAIDAEINKSLLVNLVEGMLMEAVRQGASDIHIIPQDAKTTEILFRIDGKLRTWYIQEGVRPEAVTAVVKDRSRNVDRFEREAAQDGFIQRKIDGHMIRFRVSLLPIVGKQFQYKFESIVIRILDDRKVITDFDKLGFRGATKDFFIKAISKPQGMIIITGPTGSGKSTTLIAALSYIISPEINVLTVEDPVEYIIPGVRQIKIGPKNGFQQALRSILRHDPDVVMVGEIRDKETAETGIKLANTGHLTFSTLHTNDAPSAVSRLYKMGIEPFLIAYAINIIIAQRLIRKLCEKCKQPIPDLDAHMPASLGFTGPEIKETVFYRAVGCKHCNKGYKGRIAIHEALYFSKEIRSMIFAAGENINEEAIRNLAIRQGMLSLRDAARERVKEGITTLEEVAYATTEE